MMGKLDLRVEEFEGKLRPTDRQGFKTSTFEDLQRELSTIQSQQDKTKTLMNMNRIRDFRGGMEELKKSLEFSKAGDVEKAMAYVWGPMRFLLQVCFQSLGTTL